MLIDKDKVQLLDTNYIRFARLMYSNDNYIFYLDTSQIVIDKIVYLTPTITMINYDSLRKRVYNQYSKCKVPKKFNNLLKELLNIFENQVIIPYILIKNPKCNYNNCIKFWEEI